LRHEAAIDTVVAVSETTASRFRYRLQDANKLRIVHNGTVFPLSLNFVLSCKREDDIVFLGGDNHFKGAFDVIALWKVLQSVGSLVICTGSGRLARLFAPRSPACPTPAEFCCTDGRCAGRSSRPLRARASS
jgi:hypothetical protein